MKDIHDRLHDRMRGAVLASALGDAFGAPYEGGVTERLIWGVLGRRSGKRRWTDDTQMSVDVLPTPTDGHGGTGQVQESC